MAVPAAAAALSETPLDEPCPVLPLRVSPLRLHLTPGFLKHQSWIEFPVAEPNARGFVLCLDQRIFDANSGNPPANGVVRANVSTRWVDAQWFMGRLDAYNSPRRWELVYTT
jgi:hypothetical protein